eukprot:COSAG01_NODE_164_length_23340_cov_76.030033_6_plen_157_part_00
MSLAIVDVLVIAVRAIIEDLGLVVVGPSLHNYALSRKMTEMTKNNRFFIQRYEVYIYPPLPWKPKKVRGFFGQFCHPLTPHTCIRHSLALRLQSVSDLEPVTENLTRSEAARAACTHGWLSTLLIESQEEVRSDLRTRKFAQTDQIDYEAGSGNGS